jgi:hypothetical protein
MSKGKGQLTEGRRDENACRPTDPMDVLMSELSVYLQSAESCLIWNICMKLAWLSTVMKSVSLRCFFAPCVNCQISRSRMDRTLSSSLLHTTHGHWYVAITSVLHFRSCVIKRSIIYVCIKRAQKVSHFCYLFQFKIKGYFCIWIWEENIWQVD